MGDIRLPRDFSIAPKCAVKEYNIRLDMFEPIAYGFHANVGKCSVPSVMVGEMQNSSLFPFDEECMCIGKFIAMRD